MRVQRARLSLARRVVRPVKIQTDLANANYFAMRCQRAERFQRLVIQRCRVMRMNPDDCVDARVFVRARDCRAAGRTVHAGGDERGHAGGRRARDHRVQVI